MPNHMEVLDESNNGKAHVGISMAPDTFWRNLIIAALSTAFCFIGPTVRADEGGLDGYVGRWDVRVKTLQPVRSEVTSTETYEWVLDGQFIRGQTGRKSDGTQEVIYATYDEQVDGYPFWIFSSSGTYVYLAPGTWDARTRTMEWKNPSGWDISYRSRCIFPDENTRHCTMIMKDWKGTVLSELEWSAFRRSN